MTVEPQEKKNIFISLDLYDENNCLNSYQHSLRLTEFVTVLGKCYHRVPLRNTSV
jgi:hypothetical protein